MPERTQDEEFQELLKQWEQDWDRLTKEQQLELVALCFDKFNVPILPDFWRENPKR